MLFQSWAFAAFFLVFYLVYLAVKGTRLRHWWLLGASYFFYAWADPLYLILISWSILVDYFAVVLMEKRGRKKRWLAVSVINNIALLGFFKYGSFAAHNLNALLDAVGSPFVISEPTFLLPVGLSFYIFQSLSYTIDYYRGDVERERSLLRYAVFVSLFPRLLAGPIERARHLLPQMRRPAVVTGTDIADGASLFVVGLFKKVAIADYLALYVNKIYDAPGEYQAGALIAATFLFTWQIYFDFSGYTDMARGIARTMGIRLMLNFDNPYLASSLGEFWNRWHISLSSWFKDYVYIPLGGNRKGKARTYINMFVTMVISGLWHGAAWTFVIWGAVHGLARFATRALESTAFYRERVPRIAKQAFVFLIVMFAWIFFRAPSLSGATLIIRRMFTTGWGDPQCPLLALFMIAAVWAYQFAYESRVCVVLQLRPVRIALVVLMIVYMTLFVSPDSQPFIYMKF